ncbi:MAG TPA: leucyl aminopeptidase family protein [Acidimicrobiia bacterium]|nr:leucyl aminopeptidase family protein [Acidimicrobiia bacterium]
MAIDLVRADEISAAVDARGAFAIAGELDALPAPFTERFAEVSGFRGKAGELLTGVDGSGRPFVVAGLGARHALGARVVRRAAGALGRALQHAATIAVEPGAVAVDALGAEAAARAVAEGVVLGVHRFAGHKSQADALTLSRCEVVVADPAADRGVALGAIVASAVAFTRDLADETPARLGAPRLAEIATEVAAAHDLHVTVWDEHDIERERLGCLRAVNAGSREPARLIQIEYTPPGVDDPETIVVVGKGITFDSGGLSLKRPEHMYEMKGDMGGGAAVLAVLGALPAIAPRVRVVGIVAATDNLPGPDATRPGEVVVARNGKTVEILDTDAEGRLVLADGLSLGAEREPVAMFDIATLTGYRTLGPLFTAVMGNDDALVARVLDAAARAGELAWPLPLPEQYRENIDSPVADLRNIGDPDQADSLLAGLFLREFVNGIPWVHLDIGETGWSSKDDGELTKGATGAGVRTLLELLAAW